MEVEAIDEGVLQKLYIMMAQKIFSEFFNWYYFNRWRHPRYRDVYKKK